MKSLRDDEVALFIKTLRLEVQPPDKGNTNWVVIFYENEVTGIGYEDADLNVAVTKCVNATLRKTPDES